MGCWANLVVLDLFNPTGQKSCSVSVVLWEDQDFCLETVRVGLAPDFFFFLDISVIVLFLRLFAIVLSCCFFFFTSLPSCSSRLTSNVFGPTSPLFLLSTRPNQLHPVCPVAVLWSKCSKTDWCWFDWLTQYLKPFLFSLSSLRWTGQSPEKDVHKMGQQALGEGKKRQNLLLINTCTSTWSVKSLGNPTAVSVSVVTERLHSLCPSVWTKSVGL